MPGDQGHGAGHTADPKKRALVIGGGGAAGNAWALGVIAGLAEAGVDVTDAEIIVGTSSGSTVAAQITSGTRPGDLYAAVLTATPQPHGGQGGPGRAQGPQFSGEKYLEWTNRIIASAADAAEMRRTIGAAMLEMDKSDGSARARWRDVVAARLPSPHWPNQCVLITAVNAQTGAPVVFDRHSGVDLVDAVAASMSNGFGPFPPYRIGENRFIDGGYRRNENADLAAGCGRVLVLSPFGGRSRMPHEWGLDLATQVDELRALGSQVGTVFPDSGAGEFGANALDPSTRLRAARGGHDQGRTVAAQLAESWR